MASLTIRNIPDDAKHRFRQVAAAHSHSMEEHMRKLLLAAIGDGGMTSSALKEGPAPFKAQTESTVPKPAPHDDWVHELIRLANGAGEGVFDPEPQPLREFDL